MFKKMFKRLLNNNSAAPANLNFFEDSRRGERKIEQPSSSITRARPVVASAITPPTFTDQYQVQFYHFLFGKGQTHQPQLSDELSLEVAEQIDKLLDSPELIFESLPVLPLSLVKIMAQSASKQFDIENIITLIEQEPAIAAKVLEIANSPIYNKGAKEVVAIRSAFMRIGIAGLSEGVINGFLSKLVPQQNIYFQLYGKRIWQHSLCIGSYAQALIATTPSAQHAEQGYLLGLISRLGDVIIYQLLLDAFAVVHPDCCPDSVWFKDIMCKNSRRLTYRIAKHWHFPQSMIDVLASQENIQSADQCQAVVAKNPLALYIYEARIISELKMQYDGNYLKDEPLRAAKNTLLYSREAHTYFEQVIE